DGVEQQRRPSFCLNKVERLSNPVVAEVLNRPELALRLAPKPVLFLGRRGQTSEVDPHAPAGVNPRPRSEVVLPTGAFVDEITEFPVPHPATSIGRLKPCR